MKLNFKSIIILLFIINNVYLQSINPPVNNSLLINELDNKLNTTIGITSNNEINQNIKIDLKNSSSLNESSIIPNELSLNQIDFNLKNQSNILLNVNLTNDKLIEINQSNSNLTKSTETIKDELNGKSENLPTAESSTINESKLDNTRSTNEDDEFDEFDTENKKDDESSVIDNDKSNNKIENNQPNKINEENKLKDNGEINESKLKIIEDDESDYDFGSNLDKKTNLQINSTTTTTISSIVNDVEHEEDDEDSEDEINNDDKKSNSNQSNDKKKEKGEKERESLLKLQNFLQNTVEQSVKSALPELLKIGYETNISSTCTNSFLAVTRGLQATKGWAYKIIDASGKPPSGILDGTLTDFGAFDLCLSVDTRVEQPDEINHFTGKYCILDIKPDFDEDIPFGSKPPLGIKNDSVIWHSALQLFWSRNSLLSFRYGLCAPSICSDQDLQILAQYFFKPTGMTAEVGFCQLSKEQNADTLQIIIILILSIILLTVFIGTVLEISLKRLDKQQLLASNKNDNFWFMPIANFTLSVETYFFISGMLVVYANWKKLKNSNGKINAIEFLIHRVWRIWPPYLVVIACVLILPLFGSGPLRKEKNFTNLMPNIKKI